MSVYGGKPCYMDSQLLYECDFLVSVLTPLSSTCLKTVLMPTPKRFSFNYTQGFTGCRNLRGEKLTVEFISTSAGMQESPNTFIKIPVN